jgi:radical SAM superfamily enzyme YgiQ (UPF0313 family)
MRALLVQPAFPVTYWGFQHGLAIAGRKVSLPPLGMLTLAAQLPSDWELRLVDLNIEPLRDEDVLWSNVVLVGGMRVQSPSIHEVLARARTLGRRSAVGGPAPTTAPEEYADADVVFQGEAEGRIEDLARAIRSSVRCVLPAPENRPGIADIPVPRYDLIDARHYASMSVQYSRGCPYNCEFCDIIAIFGRRPRVKTPEQILREFDALYESGHRGSVFVVDDNFIGNRPKVKELLPHIAEWQKERGNPFELYTEASVNLASDEALMQGMAAAGFTSVFLGIESPSAEALAHARKTQNLQLDLHEAVDKLARHGMEVMGGFIVGFDEDDETIFDRQEEFISTSAIPLAMVGLLTALPGTALWKRLEREGRLRDTPIGDQFTRPNFATKLDERVLLSGYRSLMTRVYSPDAYYDRCESFLERAKPVPGRRPVRARDLLTLVRALWMLGVRGTHRRRFWRIAWLTLTRRRWAFPWAVAHAIMGEHCIRYTREDVLPRIEGALADLAREGRLAASPRILAEPALEGAQSAIA